MTDLTLVEVKRGVRFPTAWLRKTLGDRPKWAVRFAALYRLDAVQFGALLRLTCPGVDIVEALTMTAGDHSGHLQDYIVELGYENRISMGSMAPEPEDAEPVPDTGLLTEMFEQAEVRVAETFDDIGDTIGGVLGSLPGKKGRQEIKAQLKLSKTRNTFGVVQPAVVHDHLPPALAVLDVSASMGQPLIERVVDEFVALATKANAVLAIVSDSTTFWEPGTYTRSNVMDEAEFSGTHYETLSELLDRDWSVVITLADWDSSRSAYQAIGQCKGRIGTLLDISVVPRPTFLAECLGQLADEVRPLMVSKASLTYAY